MKLTCLRYYGKKLNYEMDLLDGNEIGIEHQMML